MERSRQGHGAISRECTDSPRTDSVPIRLEFHPDVVVRRLLDDEVVRGIGDREVGHRGSRPEDAMNRSLLDVHIRRREMSDVDPQAQHLLRLWVRHGWSESQASLYGSRHLTVLVQLGI